MLASSVFGTVQALACVRVADAWRCLVVHIPIALTRHADAVGAVIPILALVTVRSSVLKLALVAYRLSIGVNVTAACGHHRGTGAGLTAVCKGSTGPVEIIFAFFTEGSFCAALAVQTGA